jgi:protein SCO1/2
MTAPPGVMRLGRRQVLAGISCALLLGCKKDKPKPLYTLPSFVLENQMAQPMGSKQLADKVWIAAFFFTRCPTICPRITARMLSLAQTAAQQALDLHFVMFSVDPDNDTPAVLAKYAAEKQLPTERLQLLTGDLEVIKKTSVQGFKVALEGKPDESKEHLGLLHGTHLILVDGLDIVGYYRSSDDAEMAKLIADAKTLF